MIEAVAARARAADRRSRSSSACTGCRSCRRAIHPTGPDHLGVAERGHLALVNDGPAAADPDPHARRERVPESLRHPLAVALPRRSSLRLPRERPGISRGLPARRNRTSGMFGGNSNWRGPIWMPVNVLLIRALLHFYALLRRQLQDRVSHRLGQADEPVRGRQGDRRSADAHLPARRQRPASGVRRYREVPDGSALAGQPVCSTSTSTATTARGSAPATRPVGPAWSPS